MTVTAELLAIIVAANLAGGLVKGLTGLGQQVTTLALLAAAIGIEAALPAIVAPSLVANAWQAFSGGHLRPVMRRFVPLYASAALGVAFGVALFTRADQALLTLLLALVILAFGLYSLLVREVALTEIAALRLKVPAGLAQGFLAGLTGQFLVPGALYLAALRLPRDVLVQALGMLFLVLAVALALGLAAQGAFPPALGLAGLAGIPPVIAGLILGRALRRRVDEATFRRLFILFLMALGLWLAGTSLPALLARG